jgi:glycogen phosphorylase
MNPVYSLLPLEIDGFSELAELALDLRWSWNGEADMLWQELDGKLWAQTNNPWVVLQTVSRDRLRQALSNAEFRKKVTGLVDAMHQAEAAPSWFQQTYPQSELTRVAYFSMEYMLSEALPIYSGGLGNVAGDQLKAASDLGVPVVGIGLLYQRGYFRQVIDRNGAQQALYPYNDPGQLPISPVRTASGEWLRLEIPLDHHSLWLRAWQVQVGRVKLYLLDTNDPANFPTYRGITTELYGGGPELRLQQELVLGIGGWRLLEALDIHPEVCHLNEGHAAFAVLDRARTYMKATGQSFAVALAATRVGNRFTTHTAVPAGFDRFPPDLIAQYLGRYVERELGITTRDLLALGRVNGDDARESFNMAWLAVHGSGGINGVSRLHGQVSRQLFAPLFSRWPVEDVPVGYVTNGIHVPSWESADAAALGAEAGGYDRWQGDIQNLEADLKKVPDDRLWKMVSEGRKALVEFARVRLAQQLAVTGAPTEKIEAAQQIFNPNALMLGFARRFATYKRPNLLLHDPERLLRILNNPQYPVQLILAGKAHPADTGGQALIKQWSDFIRRPEAREHVVFIADYDMLVTEQLVHGVDVWINTPRRPWEASGTSGMKVLANGGLNLSELDGWWVEAYRPEVGWALGDGQEHGDDPAWDAVEAEALYTLLEQQVIPEFYNRDANGIPTTWVNRMRESIACLTPQYSANRTVREYTEQHYLPAAKDYSQRVADQGKAAQQIIDWRNSLEPRWPMLHFGAVKIESNKVESDGEQQKFDVEVFLNDLDTDSVKVELYANGIQGEAPERLEMKPVHPIEGTTGGYLYQIEFQTQRPASDFTPRLIPHRDGVAVPLEASWILWQH